MVTAISSCRCPKIFIFPISGMVRSRSESSRAKCANSRGVRSGLSTASNIEEVLPKSSTTIIPNTPLGSEVLRNKSRFARMRLHASLFDLTNIRSDT